MNIIQLKYFQVVAQEQHMTNAAIKLNITQPALSATISHIENELGVKLFRRIGRQIVLNENGQLLLAFANATLSAYDAVLRQLEQRKRRAEKTLTIAVTGIESPNAIILEFGKQYPDITINQFLVGVDELDNTVRQTSFDFMFSSILIDKEEMHSALLFNESLVLAVPAGHPIARRNVKSIRLAEAKDARFIAMPRFMAFRSLTDQVCEQAGFTPNIAMEVYSHMPDFLDLENAITILAGFSSSAQVRRNHIRILKLEDDFCRYSMYLLWRKREGKEPEHVRLFREFCVAKGNELITKSLL